MCLAIPGQLVELADPTTQLARVSVAGVRRVVNVALLNDCDPPLAPGDWVLVHVGFALARVDEAEATATLSLLEQMGAEFEQELRELRAEGGAA